MAGSAPQSQREAYARAAVITSRELSASSRSALRSAATAHKFGIGRAAILRPLGAEVEKARRLYDDVRDLSERVLAIGDALTGIERDATRLEIAKRRRVMLADVCNALQAAKSVQRAAAARPAVAAPTPAARPSAAKAQESAAATAALEAEAAEGAAADNSTGHADANGAEASAAAALAADHENVDDVGATDEVEPAANDETQPTGEGAEEEAPVASSDRTSATSESI
jgi:hypothetical protein